MNCKVQNCYVGLKKKPKNKPLNFLLCIFSPGKIQLGSLRAIYTIAAARVVTKQLGTWGCGMHGGSDDFWLLPCSQCNCLAEMAADIFLSPPHIKCQGLLPWLPHSSYAWAGLRKRGNPAMHTPCLPTDTLQNGLAPGSTTGASLRALQ